MNEQQIDNQPSNESCLQKMKRNKKIVFCVIIVCLGIVCFSLSIFAMASAVGYFSFIFSISPELAAKAYLKLYYGWFMATTYIAIIGFVIVVANTIVFFTDFTQKQRILWLHLFFYLAMLISGIVALVGNSEHYNDMTKMLTQTAGCTLPQCQLPLKYMIYRGQVTSYFIGYCITFFAYAAVYHYASYVQKRDREEANIGGKHQLNNQSEVMDNQKNVSIISNQ